MKRKESRSKMKGEKTDKFDHKKTQKDTHLGNVIEKLTVLGSMLGVCVAR